MVRNLQDAITFFLSDYILFSRLADKDYAAVTSMSWDDYGVTGWMGLKIFDNFLLFRFVGLKYISI
jgi:hypothetical protein